MEGVEALRLLESSADQGLSTAEAARRLSAQGPNELQTARRVSAWNVLLDQFKNALIIILLVAVVFSAFLGHAIEALAIAIIALFAVLLGFYQEFRAERALEALRQMAAPTASVLRGGLEHNVPAREVVTGDIIFLRTGDKIPADGRLIEAVNLQTEEAALTGESVPVEKQIASPSDGEIALGERKNMVYGGTMVSYGRGRAVVVATGMNSEFGKIAKLLESVETARTPLQENLDRVGKLLARAALAIVVVIVLLGLLRGQPLLEIVIFGIALAVAVVPEALPAVVTISLAIGVQRMVKRNALIRRLPAVETLGCVSVICSDKTGTLTKDEMTVRKVYVAGQMVNVSGSGYEPVGDFILNNEVVEPAGPLIDLLQAAALSSDATLSRIGGQRDGGDASHESWSVKGDPTEGALVVVAVKAGLDKAQLEMKFPRRGEIPFSSESKRMTTLHAAPEGAVAYAKGAPEIILKSCSRFVRASGVAKLEAAERDSIMSVAQSMAQDALRVLAVAYKPAATLEDAEGEMIFSGLFGMIDPPRPEVKAAIGTCRQAGIRPIMITGDHPTTATAVARELGLLNNNANVITGAQFDAISDSEFERTVEDLSVYARVSPAHKLRVITAWQNRGHFVAMTGDGVNDAPALKKANIGIAMGITGTDVSKEAADMTLMDDNFASIVAAVEEGRGVFENIKKYLMFLLSANLGEIVILAGAALIGWPLPLSAVQILYVNLATDGLPALALAVDPPEPDLMRRPPRDPRVGIFTRPVLTLMAAGGLWSALVNLSMFGWAMNSGRSLDESMTMVLVALVLIEFFKAYNYRSDRRSVFHRPLANKWLNWAIGWETVLLVAVVYLPFIQKPLGTFKLPFGDWLVVTGIALTIFPVLELSKWMERRGWFGAMA
jgi:P-type Ca2+ transporter type 2C